MKPHVFLTVAIALLACVSGCKTGYFHTQTRWNEDGSVSRAVLQPEELPGNVGRWNGSNRSEELDHEFDGEIRDLPIRSHGDYAVAWADADSWQDIPSHYRKQAEEGDATSVFERDASRSDLGLVVEYRWQETLTEVVKLADAREALAEGLQLAGKAAAEIVSEALGNDCDASGLNEWIATDGRKWILELFDEFYDAAIRGEKDDEVVEKAVARVCQKHGLDVSFADAAQEEDEAELHRFLMALFRKTVRRNDGTAFDDQTLETLVGAVSGRDERRYKKLKKRIDRAMNRYKADWPGGEEAFDADTGKLMTRVFGVHGAILQSPEEFRFRMDVPGQIVETNGRIQKNGRVEWQFSGGDAWPGGFSMTVRSLDPQPAILNLLGGVGFEMTAGNLQRIVDVIGDDAGLQDVLVECRDSMSNKPLNAFRGSLEDGSDEADRVDALLLLLKKPDVSK